MLTGYVGDAQKIMLRGKGGVLGGGGYRRSMLPSESPLWGAIGRYSSYTVANRGCQ